MKIFKEEILNNGISPGGQLDTNQDQQQKLDLLKMIPFLNQANSAPNNNLNPSENNILHQKQLLQAMLLQQQLLQQQQQFSNRINNNMGKN